MKTNIIRLVALISILTSCTKDNNDTPTNYQVPDLWIGSYTVDQLPSLSPLEYSFSIKPDGTMTSEGKGADGNTYYSAGTWSQTGDTVRCSYTTLNFSQGPPVTQSAKFYFEKSTGKLLNGTWRDEANGSNYTGKFPSMVRVN